MLSSRKRGGKKELPAATRQSPGRVWPLPPAPPHPARLPVPYLCLRSWWRAAPCALPAPRRDGATTLTPVQRPPLALTLPLLGSVTAGERRDRHGASPPAPWRCLSQLRGHTETSAGAPSPGVKVKRRELVLGNDAPAGDGVWVGGEERQKDEGTSWGGCSCAPGSCRVPTGWHLPFAEGAGGVSTVPDPCPGGRAGGTKGTQRGLSPQPGHCGVVLRLQRPPDGLASSFMSGVSCWGLPINIPSP